MPSPISLSINGKAQGQTTFVNARSVSDPAVPLTHLLVPHRRDWCATHSVSVAVCGPLFVRGLLSFLSSPR